jgi:glyoxylase-like metal-dependent hydrolase (beta-lactamase superfamily II)
MEITHNLHAFLWTSPSVNNCNTYLIHSPEKNILIDPGHASYFEHVDNGLSHLGLSIKDIDLVICTHAHPDHIEAIKLFENSHTLFTLHEAEWKQIKEMEPYIKNMMNIDISMLKFDFFLTEGNLNVGDINLEVYHTPGHSPGSVTLYWPLTRALFTGDLIFNDGLGRTDLPGGNGSQLKESIRRIAGLDAEWLLSGHGGVISGVDAIKENFEQVERMWFAYI